MRAALVAAPDTVRNVEDALSALARRHRTNLFPELDCVRTILPPDVIANAERRAAALGVGAQQVLIANGAIDEEVYVRALARHIGVAFEPLEEVRRAECPSSDPQLLNA